VTADSVLRDRVVVVLGGTGGIGRALADGLRAAGALVVVSSRRHDAVAQAMAALGMTGPVVACDTTDEGMLTDLRDAVLRDHGRVDGLVNCAGVHQRGPALDLSTHEWEHVLRVNLTGVFLACRTFAQAMIAQGRGRIVNITSMAARVALPPTAAYAASKAGVDQLTRSLAAEWGVHGVTVNAVAPGFFLTELNADIIADGTERRRRIVARTPMGRIGDVRELVGAVAYLCSEHASFTTGTTIEVDGGFLSTGL
jgi:NAD(P)-dependent dehydrogenase (short-subunit alcohol dehydrogenase family)